MVSSAGGGASGQLGAEGVQSLLPGAAQLRHPCLDLVEGGGLDGVQPPGAIGADGREPVLPKHPQVLGHRRLADPELGADPRRDIAGRALLLGEELQDPSTNGVTHDVERLHGTDISC